MAVGILSFKNRYNLDYEKKFTIFSAPRFQEAKQKAYE